MCLFLFFFQAEDGIRDLTVTGVQTCALPILHSWNFADGSTSTAANPSHTYASAGTYSVSETVYDSVNNRSSTKTVSITVTASTSSQLIVNGGFETGSAAPWALTAGVLCSNSGCPGETAHSGSWFAWLDAYGVTHTAS